VLCHYTDDEGIGASLAHYGEWAEEELYLLSSFIRPADIVIDVGAFWKKFAWLSRINKFILG
jgi:hypothetical protein